MRPSKRLAIWAPRTPIFRTKDTSWIIPAIAVAPYRPLHEAVVPSPLGIHALLTADPCAKGAGRGEGKDGKHLVTNRHRALWALCYFTAARPESEPCKLTHKDVELPDGHGWGAVTYRRDPGSTKGETRRVLLHPEAVDALRAVMKDKPTRFEFDKLAAWEQTPIFRKRGSRRAWDSSSYRKAWSAARRAVAKALPEVEGMWLRDMRKVAKTRMIDGGVSELVVNRSLGHSDGVAGRYYKLTDDAMRGALEALTLGSCTPESYAADAEVSAS